MRAVVRAGAFSCVVMASGDVLCQYIQKRDTDKSIDWSQTARFALTGLTLHGPYFLYGFRLIDKVPLNMVKSGLGKSIAKSLLVQVTIYPVFVGVFFTYMGLLEGIPVQDLYEKKKTAALHTLAVGTLFWPLANVVNFSLVAPANRVYYVAGAGVVWNAIVSWINSNSKQSKKKKIENRA